MSDRLTNPHLLSLGYLSLQTELAPLFILSRRTDHTHKDRSLSTHQCTYHRSRVFNKAAWIQVPRTGAQASIHTSDLALSTALASSSLSTAALPPGAEAQTEASRHTLEQRAGVPALHTALRRGHRRTSLGQQAVEGRMAWEGLQGHMSGPSCDRLWGGMVHKALLLPY